jgi:hypothetical protein
MTVLLSHFSSPAGTGSAQNPARRRYFCDFGHHRVIVEGEVPERVRI